MDKKPEPKYTEFDNCWIYKDILIVKPHYNNNLDPIIKLINNHNCKNLYFSDYNDPFNSIEKFEIDNSKLYIETHLDQNIKSVFNQSVDNLPQQLLGLIFPPKSSFNCSVDNLPSNLNFLVLGNEFNCTIDNLPSSLNVLIVMSMYCPNVDNLPSSITKLYLLNIFSQSVDNLPSGLKYFVNSSIMSVDNLPLGLEELQLVGTYFNKPIDNLPPYLTKLIIAEYFNQPLNNLPNSLKFISFAYNSIFEQSLNNLPNSIEHIVLGIEYLLPIDNIYPNLKTIKCSKKYYEKFANKLNGIEIIFIEFDEFYESTKIYKL